MVMKDFPLLHLILCFHLCGLSGTLTPGSSTSGCVSIKSKLVTPFTVFDHPLFSFLPYTTFTFRDRVGDRFHLFQCILGEIKGLIAMNYGNMAEGCAQCFHHKCVCTVY